MSLNQIITTTIRRQLPPARVGYSVGDKLLVQFPSGKVVEVKLVEITDTDHARAEYERHGATFRCDITSAMLYAGVQAS